MVPEKPQSSCSPTLFIWTFRKGELHCYIYPTRRQGQNYIILHSKEQVVEEFECTSTNVEVHLHAHLTSYKNSGRRVNS